MITVACVLRSGGIYTADWVERLAAGVRRHLPDPHVLVCLTDLPLELPGVVRIQLAPTAQPRWWAKMELFRPDLFVGRVLYLDLDTVVVGRLSELAAYTGPFGMIGDFYRPERSQSGILAWDAGAVDAEILWQRWVAEAVSAMRRHHGDGDYMASALAGREQRLDRLLPGQIVSYKVHCLRAPHARLNGTEGPPVVPAGARAVCFHGAPKVTDLPQHDPLVQAWRAA